MYQNIIHDRYNLYFMNVREKCHILKSFIGLPIYGFLLM